MKNSKKYLISFLLTTFLILSFCGGMSYQKSKENTSKLKSMNDYGLNMDSLKFCIITKGDKNAYQEFCIQSMCEKYDYDAVLLYALIMSNKYNYAPANFDIYFSIVNKYEHTKNAGEMDDNTLDFALHYLKRGAKLKEYNALKNLAKLYEFGKYVKKDTIRARQLIKEAQIAAMQ